MSQTLLVVDDEAAARFALKRAFAAGCSVIEAESVEQARRQIRKENPEVILLDYTMPGEDGMALLKELAGAGDPPAVIMMTARAFEHVSLRREVENLRQRLAGEGEFGRMIGNSPAMRELFLAAERVAATDLAVLILGESGTGKDLLAQEIHARSGRGRASSSLRMAARCSSTRLAT